MLRISGSVLGYSAEVEVDEWIPLKASWWPRRQVQPLYVRVSGAHGRGEVEFKLDPENGRLLQFILIEEPPIDERPVIAPTPLEIPATPVFDLTPWEGPEDLEGAVMSLDLEMSLSRGEDSLSVRFSDEAPATVVSSGIVELWASRAGTLVCVTARAPRVREVLAP